MLSPTPFSGPIGSVGLAQRGGAMLRGVFGGSGESLGGVEEMVGKPGGSEAWGNSDLAVINICLIVMFHGDLV